MNVQDPNTGNEKTLESWKEIAAYIQRDAKTARRWEKEEGLPVHRHSHSRRSSVYAFPGEIDAWRLSRKETPEPVVAIPSKPRPFALAATIVLALSMVGSGLRYASAQSTGALVTKRLCTTCSSFVEPGAITADGKRLIGPGQSRLQILDVATGKTTGLTDAVTGRDIDWVLLSPDNKQVAYMISRFSDGEIQVIANKSGSTPRTLIKADAYSYFEPIGWTPDNSSLPVFAANEDRTWEIISVSASTGAVKPLKNLQWRLQTGRSVKRWGRVSPDGKYVSYGARATNPNSPNPPEGRAEQHIYVLAIDGSGESDVVKTAAINENPEWTPDGKHIVFVSEVSGKRDLWSIAISQGKPTGSPVRLMLDIGDGLPVGFTKSGQYFYTNPHRDVEFVTVSHVPGSSGPIVRFPGIAPEFSPDGKSIAFKRHRPGGNEPNSDVFVRSLETGDERAYPSTLGTSGEGTPHWFHDGKTIFTGLASNGARAYYQVDIATGDWKQMLAGVPNPDALSLDDRTLYVARGSGRALRIAAYDLANKTERTIVSLPDSARIAFALSPDGRELAARWMDAKGSIHITRVGVDGNNAREVYTEAKQSIGFIAWIKSGIVFTRELSDGKYRLMRLPSEGGSPVPLGVDADGRTSPVRFNLDGSQVAFSSKSSGNDVWIVDNVLAALK